MTGAFDAERTRIETELRDRERELQTVLRHSPDVISRVGQDYRITYANEQAARYIGQPASFLIGKRVTELPFPRDLLELWFGRQQEVFASGKATTMTFQLPTPQGDRELESQLVPETDDAGRVISIITFTRDVTDLARALRALDRSETKFRAIIEHGNEVVALLDEQAVVRYITPSVRTMDADPEQATGHGLPVFLHADDRERVMAAFNRTLRTPGARETIPAYRAIAPTGRTLWVEAVFTNMLDHPAIAAIVMHAREVTERVEAEAARARAEEQFRQAQKMEAIGRLAGGVAHDFNNLLTAITGSAELAHEAASDEEIRADLETIRNAAYKAAAITRQLLAFGRKQMTSPKLVDVSDAVQNFEPLMRRLVSPEVSVELVLDARCAINIDPVQLEQALLNLVVNANDAMPKGGHLTVRTEGSDDGTSALIEVEDTGCGIEESIRPRIFEPFFTTKAPGQGTGLGLATVYGIVVQAGGRVEVETLTAKGTTFRLAFPAAEGSTVRTAEHRLPTATLSGTETILLVDDEASVRLPIGKALGRLGYQVIEAKHGKDALTLLAERGDSVDMVITDLVMPEMGGAELIAQLRAEQPTLPVMFISGYSRDVGKARGAAEDAPFLQKPFSMDTLVRTVRETLDRARSAGAARREARALARA